MTAEIAVPPPARVPTDVSPHAVVQVIDFVDHIDDVRPTVALLPTAQVRAVVAESRSWSATTEAHRVSAGMELLLLPALPSADEPLPPDVIAWTSSGGYSQSIVLHGAAVAWGPGRAAIRVESGRLDAVRAAVVEFCFQERELAAIEAEVAASWPAVEADAGMAFEFRDRDADRRHALRERFLRTIGLRTRLARLVPHLDRPPLHPPTLASQVGERMRERSRLTERAGFLEGHIEVHERVYDLCGQRSSEWGLARRSLALEWAIIVLLAVEVVLILVDLLAASGA